MRSVRSRGLLSCLVLLSLTGALVACSDDDSSGSVPVYHDGDSITVPNGSRFVVALESTPSTGYSWQAQPNDTVKFESSKQVEPTGVRPGAPGEQQLTFRAVKKGASTLDFAYSRSFEAGVPPARTETFDLEIT